MDSVKLIPCDTQTKEIDNLKQWQELWTLNYSYATDLAQECVGYQKETYKGDPYLPWAFMEKALYLQDPNAEIEYLGIDYNTYTIRTVKDGVETLSTVVSPMVRLQGTFLGKTMWEVYPIQDNDYSAPRAINQNMINRAIQRGKTRLISKLTGIGWKIYEKGDLQFEGAPDKPEKPTSKPVVKEEVAKQEEKANEPNENEIEAITLEIVDFIKNADSDKINKVLLNYNTSLIKSYGFSITQEESEDDLVQKVDKIKNKDKFLKGLERLIDNV